MEFSENGIHYIWKSSLKEVLFSCVFEIYSSTKAELKCNDFLIIYGHNTYFSLQM